MKNKKIKLKYNHRLLIETDDLKGIYRFKSYVAMSNTVCHLMPSKLCSSWTKKGLANKWKLVDHGNGVRITNKHQNLSFDWDHSQAYEMWMLLREYNRALKKASGKKWGCWSNYKGVDIGTK